MQTIIRKGVEKDVPALLSLIKELADYEKAPNEVTVTETELLQDGFGESKIFDFYVAELSGKIIGIALYYTKYSTWKGKCIFLEDIIVTQQQRRNGIGRLLFDRVAEEAKKQQVKRMEWQVLNWNTSAIEFYKKLHSQFDDEWINCKLSYQQLQDYKPLNYASI